MKNFIKKSEVFGLLVLYKIKKGGPRVAFLFLSAVVETQSLASLHQPIVIYCMTVTRLTVIPLSVYTRTMYMPAVNCDMFMTYVSSLTSVS